MGDIRGGGLSLPPLNKGLIGREFESGPFLITREKVLELIRLLDDPTWEERVGRQGIVPPYFLITLLGDTDPVGQRPDILFAGIKGDFFLPIRIEDSLRGKGRIVDVYEKQGRSGRMIFVVEEVSYYNQKEDLVARLLLSWVRRDHYEPGIPSEAPQRSLEQQDLEGG